MDSCRWKDTPGGILDWFLPPTTRQWVEEAITVEQVADLRFMGGDPASGWATLTDGNVPFRGLLGLHTRCGPSIRRPTQCRVEVPRSFSHSDTLLAASVATGVYRHLRVSVHRDHPDRSIMITRIGRIVITEIGIVITRIGPS